MLGSRPTSKKVRTLETGIISIIFGWRFSVGYVCCTGQYEEPAITTQPLPNRAISTGIMLAFGASNCYAPGTREVSLGGGALSRGGGVERLGTSCTVRSRPSSLPAVSELVGASEETGGVFDPLGLATDEVRVQILCSACILDLEIQWGYAFNLHA